MRISMDEQTGSYTLIPVTTVERDLVRGLLDSLTARAKITYTGRNGSGDATDFSLDFRFGTMDFRLAPSDASSLDALRAIRDMCFFTSGELIFLHEGQEGSEDTIVCTGGFCATCGCSVINFISEKEQIFCGACMKTCAHEFSGEEVILSGRFGTCVARICKRCTQMASESEERLKGMPRLRRMQEAQNHAPSIEFRIGRPSDPVSMTVDEAVALCDHNVVPEGYRAFVETNPEVRQAFDALAEYLRTDM